MNSPDILQFLDGTWNGEEDVAATPWMPAGRSRATIDNALAFGGSVLLHDYRTEREGNVWFSAHAIITAGAEPDALALFWFDSFGYRAHEGAAGNWDGAQLVFTRTSERGTTRHVYRPAGEREFTLLLETSVGADAMRTILTGTYRRVA